MGGGFQSAVQGTQAPVDLSRGFCSVVKPGHSTPATVLPTRYEILFLCRIIFGPDKPTSEGNFASSLSFRRIEIFSIFQRFPFLQHDMTPTSTRDVSQHMLYEVMWEQIRATEGEFRTNLSQKGCPLVGFGPLVFPKNSLSSGNVQKRHQSLVRIWSKIRRARPVCLLTFIRRY
jgi:hypothetical protein